MKELWSKAQTRQAIIDRSGTKFNPAQDPELALADAELRLQSGGGLLGKDGLSIGGILGNKKDNKQSLKINLKYYEGLPVIKEIKRISKPGRRVYSRALSIPKIQNGLGLAILSTSKGVMSDAEARKNNLGGEIICRVF